MMTIKQRVPIIDAHQHFWDLDKNYHPWLCNEPMIPFRYGDYSAIRKNYMPPDYFADAAGYDVAKTVYVEAEWNPDDPLGETRWIHQVHEQYGMPNAVVAQAWLDRDDCASILMHQAQFPLVRSIRHKPRAAACADEAKPGAPGSMGDPRWRAGFALLRQYGLSFDLQTPYWHFYEALALAEDFPATPIILNHTGLPADRSDTGLADWHNAMRALAEASNVSVKISGIGVPGQPWRVEGNRRIVLDAIEIFGAERCMFASNFPVDKLVASFDTIFGGFLEIAREFSPAEQRALFYGNASRIYRID